jgi:hypothetical protein
MVNMGVGQLGLGNMSFSHRKPRYTLSGEFPSGKLPEHFVKYSHDGEKKEFTTTFFDVTNDSCKELWTIFAATYDAIKDPIDQAKIDAQKGTALITVYNGVGEVREKHKFTGTIPSSINFGDLDFSSSECYTIEAIWKYDTWEFETPTPKFVPVPPVTAAKAEQPPETPA